MKSSTLILKAITQGHYTAWTGKGACVAPAYNFMCHAVGAVKPDFLASMIPSRRISCIDRQQTRQIILDAINKDMENYCDTLHSRFMYLGLIETGMSTSKECRKTRDLALNFWLDLVDELRKKGL